MKRNPKDLLYGIWRETVWAFAPNSRLEAGRAIVQNFLLHWFPAKTAKVSMSWGYSLWLGAITTILFGILTVTGIYLIALYIPSVERAYWTVKDLDYLVSYGWLLRGVHRWSAHLMVACSLLHMARVFFTGAYKSGSNRGSRRPLNWIVGIVLMLCTILLSFTGYLLPWDQLALWAVSVGAGIARATPFVSDFAMMVFAGGTFIDQNTLIRFYWLHIAILPTVVILFLSWHMWRIRKDGGMAAVEQLRLQRKKQKILAPVGKTYTLMGFARNTSGTVFSSTVAEEKETVYSTPYLTRRIFIVTCLTTAVVVLMATFLPSPLEEEATLAWTPNPSKAPWYFLWLQELVAQPWLTIPMPGFVQKLIGLDNIQAGFIGGQLIPGLLVGGLALWPFIDRSPAEATGVWFHKSRRGQNIGFGLMLLGIILLILFVSYIRGPYWGIYWHGWPKMPHMY